MQVAWGAFSLALNFVPSREALFALLEGPPSGAAAAPAAPVRPVVAAVGAGDSGSGAAPVAAAAAAAEDAAADAAVVSAVAAAPPLPTSAEALDAHMEAFISGMGDLLAEIHSFLSAEGQDDPAQV